MIAVVSLFLWALAEEVLKVFGVKMAVGTKFIAPALLWFFLGEALLKIGALTDGANVSADEVFIFYFGATAIGISTSVIHLYTSVFYLFSRNFIYSVPVCTFIHAAYNYYGDNYVENYPKFVEFIASAWIGSSLIAIVLFIALRFERKFIPALEA
ncbi:hypothetical protein [Sinorhizobium sp. NFACC03]|uniref:hypothetical protein n=1 Tax=Sinorhizobium sp. NFACC03 TaxID=1566295 RepID=UPI000889530E|nr:hypothetical protein [Sinorhizobium sp. NFACC03]SDA87765.1 hypothetical protein SAMN03159448_04021 [Sinorhizobium sp. NFACC03]